MKLTLLTTLFVLSLSLSAQYATQADTDGTTAIHMDSSIIVSWATGHENYIAGTEVDETWQTPGKALGHAQGTSSDIVCLGRGGEITFTFDTLIVNGEGADFVCFENALSHTFLELGWVEVSMDGVYFERFPNRSLTESLVGAFDDIDPTRIHGYCSKYRQGYGTPFNLDSVSLDTIQYVRFIDIVGNGNALDTDGNIIYDPYATTGSAGLDIDAVGVIHAGTLHEGIEEISSKDFKIYPNPAKDNLQLIINNEQVDIQTIEIYNIAGRLVNLSSLRGTKQSNTSRDYFPNVHNGEIQIDVSQLNEGIYFLKIKTKQASITKKLIIKR